jgi:DegV family protein with EDD domain
LQIVSDRAMDLAAEQLAGLKIHLVPLTFTLDGKTYRSGVDVEPDEFYQMLAATESYPTTSQPSAGEFAEVYRQIASTDPDILSIHVSSGLSGTLNSARAGAALVPEARVTFVDTKTLSGAQGWQVHAAARAANAGWSKEKIVPMLGDISAAAEILYTLATLKYLIHGGRISHLKGLLGSVLNLKPLIGVEKERGTYVNLGQARTLDKAILKIADHVAAIHPHGTALQTQVMHGHNPEGAALLRERMDQYFRCSWLPTSSIAPVLGAHTGPGLVGLVYAPISAMPKIP